MRKTAAVAWLTALLVACGGGGGGGTDAPAAQVAFNVDAAMTTALSKGVTVGGMQGQISGATYNLSQSFTPSADAAMRGVTYKIAQERDTILSGASAIGSTSSTLYFTTGPAQIVYSKDTDGSLRVYTPTGVLPTAATVGQSGPWNKRQRFANDIVDTVTSSGTTTWSLEADGPGTALACLHIAETVVAPVSTSSETHCYRIDPAGNVLPGGRFTGTVNGQTITFQ